MKQSNFLNNFINALYQKIKRRSDLVLFISETLNIERDAASRRLNKKVYFNVEEIGTLSLKLGISLDSLLNNTNYHFHSPPFSIHFPMEAQSMNQLANKIESDLQILGNVCAEQAECGFIFTFPPIEFLIPYKHLLKFAYFKWGYYYVGASDFNNYATWETPESLLMLNDKIMEVYNRWEKVLYIWDISAIWSLVKDIMYFNSLDSLNHNDTKVLKVELHDMLYQLETKMSGASPYPIHSREIDTYVSGVHIGANFSYYISENSSYNTFHTYFAGTNYNDDHQTSIQLKEWMNSMKKVCSLISGSGARERKLFFDEQHKIVDAIGI
ncbi:MAG: hypothetical protein E6767_11090 [Dysgonomonas sp.]|nr:hypothetical protein [Dysgonomonas sp.]